MELINSATLKDSLREISPTRIAVTVLGPDWRSYLDAGSLQEVVISPVLGTSPAVLAELADQVGWNHLHFLDNLPTKIFLGRHKAIGSFNLAANGVDPQLLDEAGFISAMPAVLAQLGGLYEAYRGRAMAAYPTSELKQERLAALRENWGSGVADEVFRPRDLACPA